MPPTFDNTQQEEGICGVCGSPCETVAQSCEDCAENGRIKRQFRRESIRFFTVTLIFIGVWTILAAWLKLDMATGFSVGLLVMIAGMTFGLMYCDAVEDQSHPKR